MNILEFKQQEQQRIITDFKKEIQPLIDIKIKLIKHSIISYFKNGKFIYSCQNELDRIDSILDSKQKYCQSLLNKAI